MNDEEAAAAAPPRWKSRETWIVIGLILVFLLFGLRTYRERRVIARADRLKEDMRTFALALNTYQKEEGAWPPPAMHPEPEGRAGQRLSPALTTPVAYSNRLMSDPFVPEGEPEVLNYIRREDGPTTGADPLFNAFVLDHIGGPVRDVDYVFWSRGPDGDLDTRPSEGERMTTVRYDPTNGARSDGDLIFWGPVVGIRRNPYVGTAAAGLGPLR